MQDAGRNHCLLCTEDAVSGIKPGVEPCDRAIARFRLRLQFRRVVRGHSRRCLRSRLAQPTDTLIVAQHRWRGCRVPKAEALRARATQHSFCIPGRRPAACLRAESLPGDERACTARRAAEPFGAPGPGMVPKPTAAAAQAIAGPRQAHRRVVRVIVRRSQLGHRAMYGVRTTGSPGHIRPIRRDSRIAAVDVRSRSVRGTTAVAQTSHRVVMRGEGGGEEHPLRSVWVHRKPYRYRMLPPRASTLVCGPVIKISTPAICQLKQQ